MTTMTSSVATNVPVRKVQPHSTEVFEIADIREAITFFFNEQLGFAMVCEAMPEIVDHDCDIHLLICLKHSDDDMVDVKSRFMEYLDEFQKVRSESIYVDIIESSYLKYHLNCALQFGVKEGLLRNKRKYQGYKYASLITSEESPLCGKNTYYEKYRELSDKIMDHWSYEFFGYNRDQSHSQLLQQVISYEPAVDQIKERAQMLCNIVEQKQDEIITLLTQFEPHYVAEDEVHGVIDTLKNIDKQYEQLQSILGNVSNVSVFLPINLPLYSFILYAGIIGLAVDNVFIRCPVVTRSTLQKILELIEIEKIMPHIQVLNIERAEFRQKYVSRSEVIIFTGKYENANRLLNDYPHSLFIFNGYGVNPIVVSNDADLDIVVQKVVDMRLYNGGQDCCAPDAVLVHDDVYDEFKERLCKKLDTIKIGTFDDPETKIGPALSKDNVINNIQLMGQKKVAYGGTLDFIKGIVYPTVIESTLDEDNYHEYFAPIFNLVKYKNQGDLQKYFSHKAFTSTAMFTSLFGTESYVENEVKDVVLLKDKIVLDVDCGYEAFGGYGKKANFLYYKGKKKSEPVLIPNDIMKCLQGVS
jgi:acyl-CoA reductase-like NAD-dependent aldehyde dehydrogenase